MGGGSFFCAATCAKKVSQIECQTLHYFLQLVYVYDYTDLKN